MKRNLLQQAIVAADVVPGQSLTTAAGTAGVIDREFFLSGILGVTVENFSGTAGTPAFLQIDLQDSDSETGTFEPVLDPLAGTTSNIIYSKDASGKTTASTLVFPIGEDGANGDGLYQVDLDLIGCKQFVQLTPSAAGATFDVKFALALGDKDTTEPV